MARGAGAPIPVPGRIRGALFNGQKEILSRYYGYGYRCYGSSR